MTSKDCLPIDQVLETVAGVEREAAGFYERAAQQTTDEDMAAALRRLIEQKKDAAGVLAGTCQRFRCGDAKIEDASEDDILFINVLAQSGFYRWADKSPKGEQRMTGIETVDAGLQLERNLLLFYMKFFEFSCAAQRPVFSDLISRGQRHVVDLSELRRRLVARRP